MTAGAVATAVYLVMLLAVLEVWGIHRRHSQRPWGWTGFRSQPDVPVIGLTGTGFVVAVLTGLAASLLSWAGLLPTLQAGGAPRIVVGVALAMTGLVLGLSARETLSRQPSASGLVQPVPWLTSGPFALVRNPLFTALVVTQVGVTLIAVSWLSVLALIVLIGACQLQVRSVEEPHLVRTQGSAYRSYAAHTGRFLPGVGRRLPSSGKI